jgi:hypothetical protein
LYFRFLLLAGALCSINEKTLSIMN